MDLSTYCLTFTIGTSMVVSIDVIKPFYSTGYAQINLGLAFCAIMKHHKVSIMRSALFEMILTQLYFHFTNRPSQTS